MKNNFYNFEYSSYNIFCPPLYTVRVVNRAVWSGYIERLEEEKNSFLQETTLDRVRWADRKGYYPSVWNRIGKSGQDRPDPYPDFVFDRLNLGVKD